MIDYTISMIKPAETLLYIKATLLNLNLETTNARLH